MNVRGFSVPAAADSSRHDALIVPSGVDARVWVAPTWLSTTSNGTANVVVAGTSARNLNGILPLSEPPFAVATRLPAARLLDDDAPTALKPST